ncbi:MAG TPA: type II toxin-antitoxin system prevent-host-death family antitoxin [Thermoleophilia bacterium]|nr:type II toxin-antitoxin system prevent-host-death family antitoxin [Thermoleophilia bacterium]
MTSVGIRELKAHLSRYIRLVADGEKVVVTDRGREVAVISAPDASLTGLRALIDNGVVAWSGGKPRGGGGVRAKGEPVSRTVLDMRG